MGWLIKAVRPEIALTAQWVWDYIYVQLSSPETSLGRSVDYESTVIAVGLVRSMHARSQPLIRHREAILQP